MSEEIMSTELAVPVSTLNAEIDSLSAGRSGVFSTIQGDDFASRIAVMNAVSNSLPAADNIGKVIKLKDMVVQPVELVNETTGALEAQPRIILIDADGTAYHATSTVIFKDVKNLIGILGEPHTWPAPVAVSVEKGKAKVGSYLTLKLAK